MKIKINLIPPYKKEEIAKSHNFRVLLKWEVELAVILIFLIAALGSINVIVKMNLKAELSSANMADQNSVQYQKINQYDAETKDMNKVISVVGKIQNAQLYWSKLLVKLNKKVISGIEVSKIKTTNYDISLGGKANNRDNLITFRDSIENDECFTDIDLPLSNLVARDNIDFQMNFKIKTECLK